MATIINKAHKARAGIVPFMKEEFNCFKDDGCSMVFEIFTKAIADTDDPMGVGVSDMVARVIREHGEDASIAFGEAMDEIRGYFGEEVSTDTIENFFRDGLIRKNALEIVTNDSVAKQDELIGIIQQASNFSLKPSKIVKAFDDPHSLYESMHRKGMVIPCHIEDINKRMRGGFGKKELHLFMGQMNMGKSLVLCSLASQMALRGYKVLYVSHELGDMKVKDRVVRSASQFTGDELFKMSESELTAVYKTLADAGVKDNLDIVEFATGSANIQHIRDVINERLRSEGHVYDAIFIDYLTIQAPFRKIKGDGGNTNNEIRVISQECRALAVETETAVFSAVQVNRKGIEKDVLTIAEIADGISAMHIADTCIAITTPLDLNPEKDNPVGLYRFEFLKNRSGQNGGWFHVGFDKDRQHIFEHEFKSEIDRRGKVNDGVGLLGDDSSKARAMARFRTRGMSGESSKEREKELSDLASGLSPVDTKVQEWDDEPKNESRDTDRLSLVGSGSSALEVEW